MKIEHELRGIALQEIAEATRETVLKRWNPDSCIASTRVAMEVCRDFGLRSYPLEVVAAFATRKAYGLMAQNLPHKGVEGAWSVALGFPRTEKERLAREKPIVGNTWYGHLVLMVENEWLLDASADQASRPQHGMIVKPFARHVGPRFATEGSEDSWFAHDTYHEYVSSPSVDKRWKESPDWYDKERWGRIGGVVDQVTTKAAARLLKGAKQQCS